MGGDERSTLLQPRGACVCVEDLGYARAAKGQLSLELSNDELRKPYLNIIKSKQLKGQVTLVTKTVLQAGNCIRGQRKMERDGEVICSFTVPLMTILHSHCC